METEDKQKQGVSSKTQEANISKFLVLQSYYYNC
jgi:hypothetical protein